MVLELLPVSNMPFPFEEVPAEFATVMFVLDMSRIALPAVYVVKAETPLTSPFAAPSK